MCRQVPDSVQMYFNQWSTCHFPIIELLYVSPSCFCWLMDGFILEKRMIFLQQQDTGKQNQEHKISLFQVLQVVNRDVCRGVYINTSPASPAPEKCINTSSAVHINTSPVYINTSPAPEKCINTSPAVHINTSPVYINTSPAMGKVYKYFSRMAYINTSPALEKCIKILLYMANFCPGKVLHKCRSI